MAHSKDSKVHLRHSIQSNTSPFLFFFLSCEQTTIQLSLSFEPSPSLPYSHNVPSTGNPPPQLLISILSSSFCCCCQLPQYVCDVFIEHRLTRLSHFTVSSHVSPHASVGNACAGDVIPRMGSPSLDGQGRHLPIQVTFLLALLTS